MCPLMPRPSVATTEGFQEPKALNTIERLASTTSGVLVVQYAYNDIKRLVDVDETSDREESVEPKGDDPLGQLLVDGLTNLAFTERVGSYDIDVEPLSSVGALFQSSAEARALKPKLIVGFDMRNNARLVAVCTVCSWTRDPSLSTERFTTSTLESNGLPRFNANWLLVDCVCSLQPGAGTLILLHAYLTAMRARMRGVVAVCVTTQGRDVFVKQGYQSYAYREGGVPRTLVWIGAGDLRAEAVSAHLRVGGGRNTLEQLCFRMGLTPRTSDRLQSRCPRA